MDGNTMNAANEIINILSAMGANPAPVKNQNGDIEIKINAPVINNERFGKNEKSENKKV